MLLTMQIGFVLGGVFVRSARLFALSVSVKVSARYHLFFAFFNVKPFF